MNITQVRNILDRLEEVHSRTEGEPSFTGDIEVFSVDDDSIRIIDPDTADIIILQIIDGRLVIS